MSAIHKADVLVIRKRDFRETSLIVDFYTREFGKLCGILKGIRKDPRKFASSLEPYSHNEIIFYQSRNSSMHLVSSCDMKNGFDSVRQDAVKSTTGMFMMELLQAVMPQEDKNEDVFDLSVNCLHELATAFNPHKVATVFKIKILSLSGFKPHFDSCVCCRSKISGASKFSLARGGLLCERCCVKDTAARPVFRGTVATILHIERSDFRASMNIGLNPQIKRELDTILNAFLQFHLGRELKSERVIRRLSAPIAA